MKHQLLHLTLSIFLGAIISYSQPNTPLTGEQTSWLAKANRHEKNGWIYLHIEGGPQERGFQHGYLLAGEIKEAIRILRTEWEYQSGMEWSWLVRNAGTILTARVDSENLAEIDGMVEGMKAKAVETSRDELVALNGYMELTWYWWPTVRDSFKSNSPPPKKEGCSSFIATGSMTADGKIVLGHNSMVGYQDPFCNIILDIVPSHGHRILMQAFTGYIHSGTDFFVTDAGLVGSETTIGGFFPFDPNGVPEFARMRRATQYASSIDEWCEIMKQDNNGGYANAWLLGDINTNEIARLELGLKHVGFEKKRDGYFIGSNVAEDIKLLRFETKLEETNIKHSSVARRTRWKGLMTQHKGKIDLVLAKSFESEHYDEYLKKDTATCRALCAHYELDSQSDGLDTPFEPGGTLDGKVIDATMAGRMSFLARWGSACGIPFDAKKFLEQHLQFDWMRGILKDRPSQPWTEFTAGQLQ